jgi:hypothetical protein
MFLYSFILVSFTPSLPAEILSFQTKPFHLAARLAYRHRQDVRRWRQAVKPESAAMIGGMTDGCRLIGFMPRHAVVGKISPLKLKIR